MECKNKKCPCLSCIGRSDLKVKSCCTVLKKKCEDMTCKKWLKSITGMIE